MKLNCEELTKALMEDMKPNSAPGIDGLSVKFVREFWDNLVDLVWLSLLTMKRKGRLIPMLRATILKLLRKDGKDLMLPEIYRPISLLSVFYKVASCAISNILRKCLST